MRQQTPIILEIVEWSVCGRQELVQGKGKSRKKGQGERTGLKGRRNGLSLDQVGSEEDEGVWGSWNVALWGTAGMRVLLLLHWDGGRVELAEGVLAFTLT